MILIKGNVKIELSHQGEGWDGDYDNKDPNDTPLLRFDVSVMDNGEWVEVENASYCTQLSEKETEETKKKALIYLMDYLYEPVSTGTSVKRLCQKLSWIKKENLEMV